MRNRLEHLLQIVCIILNKEIEIIIEKSSEKSVEKLQFLIKWFRRRYLLYLINSMETNNTSARTVTDSKISSNF